LPAADEEAEAPKRERQPRGRGGAHKRSAERPAPVEGGQSPDRHAEHRADSRRHHAERPPRERVAADAERGPPREPVAADVERRPPVRATRPTDSAPRRDRPRREDDAPVIGLGDHVPDFLLRPVKARARPAREPIEAEE
jgi:hypothetical protein